MAVGIFLRLELDQIGLNVVGVDLPRGPEAPGADVGEGEAPGLDQLWRKWKVRGLKCVCNQTQADGPRP